MEKNGKKLLVVLAVLLVIALALAIGFGVKSGNVGGKLTEQETALAEITTKQEETANALTAAEATLADTQKALEDMTAKKDEAAAALTAAEATLADTQKALEDMTALKDEAATKGTAAEETLANTQKALEDMTAKKDEAAAALTAAEATLTATEATLADTQKALEDMTAMKDETAQNLAAAEASLTEAMALKEAAESTLAEMEGALSEKETALTAAQAALAKAEEDLALQVAEVEKMKLAAEEAAAVPAAPVEEEVSMEQEEPQKEDVVIFFTNDVHTYIANASDEGEPAAIRYSTVAALRKNTANAILVDAGDHAQGTAYGSMDKGETITKLMSAAGYDVATLGNHEFDYGMTGAMDIIEWAQYPYVSCNFYHEENGVPGEPVLAPYEVVEVGGVKVAFVGITTPESFTKSTPAYFQNEKGEYIYGIAGGTDGAALYEYVQKAIDAAKLEADYVIGLGHLGVDEVSAPWRSTDVIANTCGFQAFIDGHSHTELEEAQMVKDEDGHDVLLAQTGEYLDNIGKMVIAADGTITIELLNPEKLADITPDADVKMLEDTWITEIDEKLGEVIGSVEFTFDNYDAEGNRLVRKQETNTGDFVTDALVYLFENMDMDVDLAIMNGGGIRNKAITGEISYLTCKDIHTFGNVACLQTVSGQQVLDALEWGARGLPDVEVGGFLHVSGLRYSVDTTIESTVQQDEKGVWIGGPTGEYRVKDVQVFDQEKNEFVPLDLNASYNMAGYNYTLRDLGDGFAMFDGAVNVLDYVMEDYMVLANYVGSFEDGKVTGYEDVQNRITIIKPETTEPAEPAPITVGGLENNVWTTKYGNLYCDCKAETFINTLGFNWADIVTVTINGQSLDLPVVPTYSYVDSGLPAIIVGMTDETGAPTGYVSFAINMGNFTETYGIATKETDEEGNWWWTAKEGVAFPLEVKFELKEKDGYRAQYIMHELARTNERVDYSHLNDEEFANFRAVATTGMGANKLYRSSSPINPELNRNAFADAALEAAGVKTMVNLADNQEDAASYEGFADSYYAGQNVIYLCLGVDFKAADFGEGLANGLRFMGENEGPYLVHCTEGKDRAGFVSAVLECLMGASYQEVVADYMTTYYNYYGIEEGTEKYNAIAESNIIASLKTAFGTDDLPKANLSECARNYLLSIGMTDGEVDALVDALK